MTDPASLALQQARSGKVLSDNGAYTPTLIGTDRTDELLAAARIDGAGPWRVFWHIVLPMSRPALGAVAIFSFMGAWNEYLWQLIVTNRPEMYTLPVGVSKLVSTLSEFDLGLAMAGATVAFLPMLAVFVMFQKYFVQGVSVGALKG